MPCQTSVKNNVSSLWTLLQISLLKDAVGICRLLFAPHTKPIKSEHGQVWLGVPLSNRVERPSGSKQYCAGGAKDRMSDHRHAVRIGKKPVKDPRVRLRYRSLVMFPRTWAQRYSRSLPMDGCGRTDPNVCHRSKFWTAALVDLQVFHLEKWRDIAAQTVGGGGPSFEAALNVLCTSLSPYVQKHRVHAIE